MRGKSITLGYIWIVAVQVQQFSSAEFFFKAVSTKFRTLDYLNPDAVADTIKNLIKLVMASFLKQA